MPLSNDELFGDEGVTMWPAASFFKFPANHVWEFYVFLGLGRERIGESFLVRRLIVNTSVLDGRGKIEICSTQPLHSGNKTEFAT